MIDMPFQQQHVWPVMRTLEGVHRSLLCSQPQQIGVPGGQYHWRRKRTISNHITNIQSKPYQNYWSYSQTISKPFWFCYQVQIGHDSTWSAWVWESFQLRSWLRRVDQDSFAFRASASARSCKALACNSTCSHSSCYSSTWRILVNLGASWF